MRRRYFDNQTRKTKCAHEHLESGIVPTSEVSELTEHMSNWNAPIGKCPPLSLFGQLQGDLTSLHRAVFVLKHKKCARTHIISKSLFPKTSFDEEYFLPNIYTYPLLCISNSHKGNIIASFDRC